MSGYAYVLTVKEVSKMLGIGVGHVRALDAVLLPAITFIKRNGVNKVRTYDPVIVEQARLRREAVANSNCYGGRRGTKGLCHTEEVRKHPPFIRAMWSYHVSSCLRKNLQNGITIEDFVKLACGDCRYCGDSPGERRHANLVGIWNGVDRIDNAMGYVPDNLVSCCKECNMMKKTMGAEAFVKRCVKVAKHWANYL